MLKYDQALILAETWIRVVVGDSAQLLKDRVLKKPYGWIFCYQSSAYLASGDMSQALAGNAPIIVDRIDGEIRVTGTARPLREYLAKYESSLPEARLQMTLPPEP
jgi:hypothetical protein